MNMSGSVNNCLNARQIQIERRLTTKVNCQTMAPLNLNPNYVQNKNNIKMF